MCLFAIQKIKINYIRHYVSTRIIFKDFMFMNMSIVISIFTIIQYVHNLIQETCHHIHFAKYLLTQKRNI